MKDVISRVEDQVKQNMEKEMGNAMRMEEAILNGKDEELEGVQIRVSHGNITDNLRPLRSGLGVLNSHGPSQANGSRKGKEQILKDVTNKLKGRPMDLKPNQVGSKSMGGQQAKDSKLMKWARKPGGGKKDLGQTNIKNMILGGPLGRVRKAGRNPVARPTRIRMIY